LTLRTWYFETAFAVAVIVSTTLATATRAIDWIACAAVIATFRHGQITDRMVEAQGALPTPTVHCYRVAGRYWVMKEVLWIAFFVLQGSYAAVVGAALFALYPAWRRAWRAFHPMTVEET
jgi:hypothetical protein